MAPDGTQGDTAGDPGHTSIMHSVGNKPLTHPEIRHMTGLTARQIYALTQYGGLLMTEASVRDFIEQVLPAMTRAAEGNQP
jgi:hypothetical protein